jgi:hypothetical protein
MASNQNLVFLYPQTISNHKNKHHEFQIRKENYQRS